MRRLRLGHALALGLALACTPSGVEIPEALRDGAIPLSADRIAVLEGPTPDQEAAVVVSDVDGHVIARHNIDVDALFYLGSAGPGWPRIFAGLARGREAEIAAVALDDATGEWRWWGRHPSTGLRDAGEADGALRTDAPFAALRIAALGVDPSAPCGARSILLDPMSGDPIVVVNADDKVDARVLAFGPRACPKPPLLCPAEDEGFSVAATQLGVGLDGAILGLRCAGAGRRRRVYAWTARAHAFFVVDADGGVRVDHRADATVLAPPTRPPRWQVAVVDGALEVTSAAGRLPGLRARTGPKGQVSTARFDALVVDGDITYAVGDGILAAVDAEAGELLGAAAIPGARGLLGVAGGALWIRADGPRPWIVVDARTLLPRRSDDARPLALEIDELDPPSRSLWMDEGPTKATASGPEPTLPRRWEAALTPAVRTRLGIGPAGDPDVSAGLVAWEHDLEGGWAFAEPVGVTQMVVVIHLGEPIRETVLASLSQSGTPWQVDRVERLPGAASHAAIVEFSSESLPEPAIPAWPQYGSRVRIGHHYEPFRPNGERRVPTIEDVLARLREAPTDAP